MQAIYRLGGNLARYHAGRQLPEADFTQKVIDVRPSAGSCINRRRHSQSVFDVCYLFLNWPNCLFKVVDGGQTVDDRAEWPKLVATQ